MLLAPIQNVAQNRANLNKFRLNTFAIGIPIQHLRWLSDRTCSRGNHRLKNPTITFSTPVTQAAALDSADRGNSLQVVVRSDGPGIVEVPALDVPRIAIYAGRPVRMNCKHGGQSHSGLAIHGDIDIIPDGMISRWEMKEPDTALVLKISRNLLREVAAESGLDGDIEIRSRFRMRDSGIEHLGWALMSEFQNGFPAGKLYLDCMATALAIQLLRNHSSISTTVALPEVSMPHRKLRQVQSYIEEHLRRNLPLQAIAAAAGMSRSQLKLTFRLATGMPVHQYVIRRRVERAALLLREGKLSVTQIALEVGFAHQSHLAFHMRRLMRVSPGYFRRSAR
jgi:AraC family transcriptional regulator